MTSRNGFVGGAAIALSLALLAGAPRPARAAGDAKTPAPPDTTDLTELSLDQLMNIEVESVYGASRYTERSLDAPTRVTVLTADDIRDHGYRTLAEALRSVAGLFVSYDRTYDLIGMRGLGHVDDYNSRVLVLVDEHRTNDNIFEGALIGSDFALDMNMVDRIEVIRGPSSALYGSNAVRGVINVVTKQARQAGGLHVTADGGSFGARGGQLSWGGRFAKRGSLLVSASGSATDGTPSIYFPTSDAPQPHNGIAEHLDGENTRRLFAVATLGDFRMQAVYGRRHKDVPTASYGSLFNAPDLWVRDTRSWLDLGYQHMFANRLGVSARLYADDYEYEGSYPSDPSGTGDGPVLINRDDDAGRWVGGELNAHHALFGPDEFVVGGEWRRNTRQAQRNWDISPYDEYLNSSYESTVWALYAEDAFNLAPRLRFNAGVRHDDYTMFGGSTHPRIGLIWTVLDRTALKLIYGSAFRVPTAYETYLWGNVEVNTALRPETFRTGEAAVESYFAEHFHASASCFVYIGEDFIQETAAGPYENSGDVRGHGLEAEVSGRWRESELRLGLTHEHVRFNPGDVRLSNSAADLLQVSGKVPLVRSRLWASADVHAIGRRLNPFGEDVPGFAITDANLVGRAPGSPWQVTLGVRNLFDTRYGDVAGPDVSMPTVPQDGRTFRARVDVRF